MINGTKIEEGEMDFAVEDEENNLDHSIGEAIDKARDLDIDLAFLSEIVETDQADKQV